MNTDIAAFALVCTGTRNGKVALLCITIGTSGSAIAGSGAIGGLELLVRVVDEILLGRHGVKITLIEVEVGQGDVQFA